jgi:hypothetical protein
MPDLPSFHPWVKDRPNFHTGNVTNCKINFGIIVSLLMYSAAETSELDGNGSDEFGTDKWSAGIRRPAANIQRWFEGQGEFSAFVVYTWLAVASASLVIVIILVRYRHEVYGHQICLSYRRKPFV